MKFKLSILFLFFTLLSFAQKTTISGIVTDKDLKGEALPFANVTIKGTSFGATTDINGKYAIEVSEGKHIVVFSFLGYESKEVEVNIAAGENKTINETIGSGSVTMEDVTVKATVSREKETALLLEQKKAVEIKQSIGAQEMSRKGVSDVEEGLTKITGISKVDGRGLFVRGLEDRYNTLLINGLAVPSNSPFKKILPLDIFSTDLVSVIETFKTFNTNIYGDFAGGTFNIVTATPTKSQTKVNFGTSFTTKSNLSNFLISEDATSTGDFFGFSGNERDIPKVVGNAPSNYQFRSQEALDQFGSGYNVETDKSPLNTSLGVLHSEKFSLGNKQNSLSFLLSANFDNKYQVRNGVDRFFYLGGGVYDNNLNTTQYKYSTNSTLLGVLNYKSNRLSITSSNFYLKTTENMIQDQLGVTGANPNQPNSFIRLNQLQETTFINSQLFANYKLTTDEKHTIKGGVSYSDTNFEMPDRKSFKGNKIDENTNSVSYTGSGLTRQYFDFNGERHVSGLLEYGFKFGNKELDKAHKLTVGYNGYMNLMKSNFRFMVSQDIAATTVVINTNQPDATFASEIQNGNFTYREGSQSKYKTKFQEFVNAGYADFAFKFGERYEVNLGARVEQSSRETKFREGGNFDDPYTKQIVEKVDFLPSVNGKYKLNENSNLRLAASKTITKPVIIEGSPIEFVNPDATIELGNINVINSDNYNLDLKYEWFPSSKEMVSVTGFSKLIQNPIERMFQSSAGSGGQIITYDNSKKAVLYGVELEFLAQLDRISESLSNFSFGLNASLMQTKVDIYKIKNNLQSIETIATDDNPSRQLQGASPWIINTDLKYESQFSNSWKSTMTMVYNLYGKRIFAVGTSGLDHYYEMPFGKLDFVWGNKLSEKWEVKFAAENLLNPNYEIEVGNKSKINILENDLTVKSYKKGIGFSMNLSYTF